MTCFVADLNHANPIDVTRLRAANWNGIQCEGIIHKASQGAGYRDPKYGDRRLDAVRAGFLWGAYHFNSGEDVAAQVHLFLSAAAPASDTALFLDFEDNLKSQMTLAQALEFLDRVDQAVGRRCGIYTGNRIKETILGATAAQRDFLAAHALWGCQYGTAWKHMDAKGNRLPWVSRFLWQYTGDGIGSPPHTLDGLQNGSDLSTFNGSRADLEKLWPGLAISSPMVAQAARPPAHIAPPPPPPSKFADFLRSIGIGRA
jgi:GH25 family lysozyme M1 (1,4-beta-N-acetylmuramidase)